MKALDYLSLLGRKGVSERLKTGGKKKEAPAPPPAEPELSPEDKDALAAHFESMTAEEK